jgi:UDP-2,4-diacetamido-2,4,6-trideoxy-beta-L-altropyranose hydrolase
MNIVFRVDASITMGTGHVMRCRTLATELKKHDAYIHFITRAHPGHLGEMLARDGFTVTLLPQPADIEDKVDYYATWLGVSQKDDADQTIVALADQKPEWLIVDHYGIDSVWETQLQSHTHKLMVIDDLANRSHECDVLLDHNYVISEQKRYHSLVPSHCQLLLGPRYALLRPEYAQYRETMEPRSSKIRRVLVFMGGADNTNITGKVLFALSAVQFAHLEVDVVIGSNFIHKDDVNRQANARLKTHIHSPRTHLADLMVRADLAIGGGGGTTWERLCLGLPSLVLSIAENQIPACEALASSEFIRYLGDGCKIDVTAIESALFDILEDIGKLLALENSFKALVDGRGTDRVAEVIIPTPAEVLMLRQANSNDALTYFSWVNDPMVRSNAINSEPVDMAIHLEWFDNRLKDVNSYLYVLEAGNLPIGQIRFEEQSGEATIDYSLDVLVRGRGWANKLLQIGLETFPNIRPTLLKATVKPENISSAMTFVRRGFVQLVTDYSGGGNLHFQLLLSPIRAVGSKIGCLK